jgi:hypothetical protein
LSSESQCPPTQCGGRTSQNVYFPPRMGRLLPPPPRLPPLSCPPRHPTHCRRQQITAGHAAAAQPPSNGRCVTAQGKVHTVEKTNIVVSHIDTAWSSSTMCLTPTSGPGDSPSPVRHLPLDCHCNFRGKQTVLKGINQKRFLTERRHHAREQLALAVLFFRVGIDSPLRSLVWRVYNIPRQIYVERRCGHRSKRNSAVHAIVRR